MNAFSKASCVEAEAMLILGPYLDFRSGGRTVLLQKGHLARALQETVGDAIFQAGDGRAWSVEVKAEREETGNLFLESWSNRNLENRASHIARGSTFGWFLKTQAELLMCYFLSTDNLYVLDMFKLKRWAFADNPRNPGRWRVSDFIEKPQGKYVQHNDTRGWCVPLRVLKEEVDYKHFNPMRLLSELNDDPPY